jgi:hypothetical protein
MKTTAIFQKSVNEILRSEIGARLDHIRNHEINTARDAHFCDLLLHEAAALVGVLEELRTSSTEYIESVRYRISNCAAKIRSAPEYTNYLSATRPNA